MNIQKPMETVIPITSIVSIQKIEYILTKYFVFYIYKSAVAMQLQIDQFIWIQTGTKFKELG